MFKMQTLWPIHSAAEPRVYASMTKTTNWPPSIHQYSNMATDKIANFKDSLVSQFSIET